MSVELLTATSEFDENPEREKIETELKFQPVDPYFFDFLKQQCELLEIDQVYLSSPSEPYSLRVRKLQSSDGTTSYTAALKDRGRVVPNGLRRIETPTKISQDAYEYHASHASAKLHKWRVEPVPGVNVDWIEGWQQPVIEIEDVGINEEAQLFYQQYRDQLVDRTGSPEVDNEHIAHALLKHEVDPPLQMEPEKIAEEILAYMSTGMKQLVVGISGRSGSGKTTVARQVSQLLGSRGDASSTILTTDNYHKGKSYLEAQTGGSITNWDENSVYDTKLLAFDIWRLRGGEDVEQRKFSFATQEPYFDGKIYPRHDIIIVEGIHAGSPDLAKVRQLHFNLGTPFATSVGRDLERIRKTTRANTSIGSPEDRLRYQLQYAEPTFRDIEQSMPRRNYWSESTRRIATIALMDN